MGLPFYPGPRGELLLILFRIRKYGSADWTEISVRNELLDSDEAELEEEIGDLIESVLTVDDLHCQRLSSEGKWEDVE